MADGIKIILRCSDCKAKHKGYIQGETIHGYAKRYGWHITYDKAYCPKCKSKYLPTAEDKHVKKRQP